MKYLLLTGRILFAVLFLVSSLGHFAAPTIGYAAAKGLPLANILVPLSGIIEIAGALSILVGFKARIGALLLFIFLVPVTLFFHNYWTITDPMARQMEMASFLKNVSLMGATLVIAYFGSGPLSIDNRKIETA